MNSPLHTQDYLVNSTVVRPGGRIGLTGLLGLLQDAAWSHSIELGHGYDRMLERQMYWVLTRQRVQVREWPRMGERLQVQTWVRPLQGPVGLRDFEVSVDGRLVAEAVSSWLAVDMRTGRAAQLTLDVPEMAYRTDRALPLEPRKIPLLDGLEHQARFPVRNSDLDVNEHVNNTRYAQWILDSVPFDRHRHYRIDAYEVNFLAETRVGDVVDLTRLELDAPAEGQRCFQFQGQREGDGKVVFSAWLTVSPRSDEDTVLVR